MCGCHRLSVEEVVKGYRRDLGCVVWNCVSQRLGTSGHQLPCPCLYPLHHESAWHHCWRKGGDTSTQNAPYRSLSPRQPALHVGTHTGMPCPFVSLTRCVQISDGVSPQISWSTPCHSSPNTCHTCTHRKHATHSHTTHI